MIGNLLIELKMKRYIILILTVMTVAFTGCGKLKDISVNSVKVEKVSPYGSRGLDVALAVEVDNPSVEIKLSDMLATLEHSGKVIGKVTVDPFTMEGRSVENYHLQARMILDEGVSLYDMLMLLDEEALDKCMIDITVKGKLKGGLSKTITKNDIPLKKLLKYADQKK
jgi:hypothetical protein